MNENVMKILEMFENMTVISILESPNNYIVTACPEDIDPEEATGGMYAVNKETFEVTGFPYLDRADELTKANDNVLYKYDDPANSDELTHWGVLGMKWGVRRYQNKDGSLTAAGKKRRAKLEADIKAREKSIKTREREKAADDKLAAKSAELDARERALRGEGKSKSSQNEKSNRPKTVSEMTNEELAERMTRMQLEANYYTAQRNLANANPPKVSAGQKFMKSIMNDVVQPAALSAGKAWAEKFLKEKLGVSNKQAQDYDAALQKLVTRKQNEEKLREYQAKEAAAKARAQQAAAAKAKQEAAEKEAKAAQKAADKAAKQAEKQAEKAAKEAEKIAKEAAEAAAKAQRDAEAAAKASPTLNTFISKVQNQNGNQNNRQKAATLSQDDYDLSNRTAANAFVSKVQNKSVSDLASANTRKRIQAQLDAGDYDFTNWGRYNRDWDRWDDE